MSEKKLPTDRCARCLHYRRAHPKGGRCTGRLGDWSTALCGCEAFEEPSS